MPTKSKRSVTKKPIPQNNRKQKISIYALLVFLIIGGPIAFLINQNNSKNKAESLFYSVVKNMLDNQNEPYTVTAKTGESTSSAEFIVSGTSFSNPKYIYANYNITSDLESEQIEFAFESKIYGTDKPKIQDYFNKISKASSSSSSSDSESESSFTEYYKPVIGKWSKQSNLDTSELDIESISEDSNSISLFIATMFTPIGDKTMTQDEKAELYNIMIDSKLFTVENKLKETTFKSKKATELKVTISKSGIIESDKRIVKTSISKDLYELTPKGVIEELFGENDSLQALVYVDAETNRYLGVVLDHKLPETLQDITFQTNITRAKAELKYEWGVETYEEPPTDFIDQSEFDALLGSGQ